LESLKISFNRVFVFVFEKYLKINIIFLFQIINIRVLPNGPMQDDDVEIQNWLSVNEKRWICTVIWERVWIIFSKKLNFFYLKCQFSSIFF